MTCFIRFYEDLDSESGLRKGQHYKLQRDGKYKVEDSIVPHSSVPNFKGPINNKIYALYPFLSKINKTAVDILGKYFHIDRLQHSLKSSENHWFYLFNWSDEDSYNKKGSYSSFMSEINSKAIGQLNTANFKEIPRREIEIGFNILESSLKLAHKNDGRMAYNFVGKSFDNTEDVLVDYNEIEDFITPKLDQFISKLQNAGLIDI